MNGREGFKAMNAKVIVLPKRDLNYKLKLVSNKDWGKSAFSCSLTRSSRRILPILASFLTFFRVFSTCFTTLTSCFLWSLCLFLSSLFSLKTLSPRTWIMTISSGWQSSSSDGIVAFRVDPKLQNTENYCSTTTSPVRFPTQNAFCNLIAYAASHLPAHVKPSSNA